MLCVKRIGKKKKEEEEEEEESKQWSHLLPYRWNPSWAGRVADLFARLSYSFHKFKRSTVFIVPAYRVQKHTQTDIPRVPQGASLSRSQGQRARRKGH